jgi:hypothetical protein
LKTRCARTISRGIASCGRSARCRFTFIQYRGVPPIYARLPVHALSDHRGNGPSFVDGYGAGYNHPVDLEYWDDDGSPQFAEMWERTAAGPVSSSQR